jgi:hypothetical protein
MINSGLYRKEHTGWMTEESGLDFRHRNRTISSPQLSDQIWASLASHSKGAEGSVLGGKAVETWSWQTPPCSAMFKNIWSCNSTPPYVFTAWHVMKQRSNFTCTFTIAIKYSYLRWDSAVGIATGRRVEVRVPVGLRIFSSPRRPDWLWGPFSLLSIGYRALSPEVKRPEREADCSPPTSAEVKKTWIYISAPPYAFMA